MPHTNSTWRSKLNKRHYFLTGAALIVATAAAFALWASQATPTRHTAQQSSLGETSSRAALVDSLSNNKTVSLSIIKSADWSAPLGGLINLENPAAKRASLTNREEPIQIYTYHFRHPDFGDYLIDTGVSEAFINNPAAFDVPGWLAPQLGFDKLKINVATEQLVDNLSAPLKGVFITHLHLDHIGGLPAINNEVPIYVGKGESAEKYFLFAATRSIVDALMDDRPDLREWQGTYVDIFKDGSVFAIHSPGHLSLIHI